MKSESSQLEKQRQKKNKNTGVEMKKEYDLAKMKRRPNPYAKKLKKQITLRMGVDVIDYFKKLSEETGMPYQNLIDMYLRDCAQNEKKPKIRWAS